MIKSLEIQNYALIDAIRIDFSKGLTIITGETGAGKSILLGALGLIMGKRADSKVLYDENQKCVVEAVFHIKEYGLKDWFDENELDYEEELIVRREISTSGKSRAFLNDTPVTLNILQELSAGLIDLHQQFDTLDLYKVDFQLKMLDALSGNQEILEEYQSQFRSYKSLEKKLFILKEKKEKNLQEKDFLNFQAKEFEEANLIPDELEDLEKNLLMLESAEEIIQTAGAMSSVLSENENSVVEMIRELIRMCQSVGSKDSRFSDFAQRLMIMMEEAADMGSEAAGIAEETEYDEQKITLVQERLNTIYRLQKKHRVDTLEQLLSIRDEIDEKLFRSESLDLEIEKIEKDLGSMKRDLMTMAREISHKRESVIDGFVDKIHERLALLAMNNARVRIELEEISELNTTGINKVSYLFAPNKGSQYLAIKDTASGGEISRLTLCIKSLVAAAIPLPTMIFDEIDTGISGDVAMKMGEILQVLAKEHQLISITHSPQIASKADLQYFVYKSDTDERTITRIKALSHDERVYELAKMLSGDPPSAAALENAKSLLS
jgi:DNA repair protein RecN (Recombination protein N)